MVCETCRNTKENAKSYILWAATPETALWPLQGWLLAGAVGLQPSSTLLDTPCHMSVLSILLCPGKKEQSTLHPTSHLPSPPSTSSPNRSFVPPPSTPLLPPTLLPRTSLPPPLSLHSPFLPTFSLFIAQIGLILFNYFLALTTPNPRTLPLSFFLPPRLPAAPNHHPEDQTPKLSSPPTSDVLAMLSGTLV
jgi:hypothetical protein